MCYKDYMKQFEKEGEAALPIWVAGGVYFEPPLLSKDDKSFTIFDFSPLMSFIVQLICMIHILGVHLIAD